MNGARVGSAASCIAAPAATVATADSGATVTTADSGAGGDSRRDRVLGLGEVGVGQLPVQLDRVVLFAEPDQLKDLRRQRDAGEPAIAVARDLAQMHQVLLDVVEALGHFLQDFVVVHPELPAAGWPIVRRL